MKHQRRPILKWQTGLKPIEQVDDLAVEEALEIRVQRRSVSVTLRTPGHDEELACGFLLTEGIIHRAADLLGFLPAAQTDEGVVINALLSPGIAVDFDRLTRHVFTSSSCGLCGKAALQNVRTHFPAVSADWTVD